jgi:hypothetical protein
MVLVVKFRVLFLISYSLLLSSLSSAANGEGGSSQVIAFKPALSIEEALKLGQGYIRERQIDVANQYIHSIQLYYSDQGERKVPYWRIQYLWSTPRLGMEQALKIFMDGTIIHERSGP